MSKSLRNPHVFCIESMWSENPNLHRQSVYPLLEIFRMAYNINIAYLTCNTLEEFQHDLKLANGKYGIIYLAMHGKEGKLLIQENELSLEMLSEMMGRKFKNCGLHLASCATLGADKSRINDFLEKTGVNFISGYKKPVYWIPSAATDLVFLDYLIDNYQRPEKSVELMRTQIIPSSKNLGFTFIQKGK